MALSFPSNPSANQTYTYNNKVWVYNGARWVVSNVSTTPAVTVSGTQPGITTDGALWVDSDTSSLSVRLSNAWVQLGGSGSTSLPTQTGQTGKYLTTDGTDASWATVSATPADGSITAEKLGLGTGYLPMAVGNTLQRPSSPATGYTRINSETNYLEVYYSNTWFNLNYIGGLLATASGTYTIATAGDYKVYTFTGSGQFQFTSVPQSATFDYLIVAGGGGGGTQVGGGGGAGGLIYNTGSPATSDVLTIVVGAAGAGSISTNTQGLSGGNSSISGTGFTTQTAIGGGGGGSYNGGNNGLPGGSGGGGYTTGGLGTSGQGKNGGAGSGGSPYGGGGGGGASVAGGTPSGGVGGAGGNGTSISITGTPVYYAGGGGGCSDTSTSTLAAGGLGGGGSGWSTSTHNTENNGTVNTGGGGGGVRDYPNSNGPAGSGGSGIVVIRYRFQ